MKKIKRSAPGKINWGTAWAIQFTRGDFMIAEVYGKTKKECIANAELFSPKTKIERMFDGINNLHGLSDNRKIETNEYWWKEKASERDAIVIPSDIIAPRELFVKTKNGTVPILDYLKSEPDEKDKHPGN